MDNIKNIEIGERVRKVRKSLSLTQEEFGKKLGFSKSFIAQVEGNTCQLSASIMINLFEVFNISIDWLLTGRGQMFILPEDHYLNKVSEKEIQIIGLIHEELNDEEQLHFWDSVRSILRTVLARRKQ